MTKPKVLISDKMDPNAARIFQERGCDVDVITGKTPDELKAVIGEYDGLAIRSATKVTKEILDAATKLKVIGRAGIGVDNVDIPAASSLKGVVVMNTPFGNSITTAEHAIALMFALARQHSRGQCIDPGRQVGKEPLHGRGSDRQDAGPDRRRQYRLDRRQPRAGPEDEGRRLRSVPDAKTRDRNGRRKGRSRHAAGQGGFHHPAHPADRPDAQYPVEGKPGQDQEGRAHRQLRARRPDRRGGAQGRRSIRAISPAPRSTCSRPSRPTESPLFGTPNFICTPHLGASTD